MKRDRPAAACLASLLLTACAAAPEVIPQEPSPTPSASAPCPRPAIDAGVELDLALPPARAVTEYLNAGGDLGRLATTLAAHGWISPASAAVLADLDGDGSLDYAVGLVGPPDSSGISMEGSVYVWTCRSGAFSPVVLLSSGHATGLPAVEQVADLTGDGRLELVAFLPTCGAHTCMAQYSVFQWDGSSMVDRFEGASDDLPSPEWIVHPGPAGRPSTIDVVAHGINSVGAGPYRMRTRTWNWDPDRRAFVVTAETIEPPRYRIHAVHDADAAFARGDFKDSLAMDERVLYDDQLLDWSSSSEGPSDLAGYAAYRRVLAFLASGLPSVAQAEFDSWQTRESGPGSVYADLAQILLAAYPQGGLAMGCAQVQSEIAADPERYLTPLDYGYANRTYAVEDLCPLS